MTEKLAASWQKILFCACTLRPFFEKLEWRTVNVSQKKSRQETLVEIYRDTS